jgi:hypothetical protein
VAQSKYKSRGGRGYRATNARCRSVTQPLSSGGKHTLAMSKLHTVSWILSLPAALSCAVSQPRLLTGYMFTTMALHLMATLVPLFIRHDEREARPGP